MKNKDSSEVLVDPCPFCGADEVELQTGTPDGEGTPSNVSCVTCGAAGPWVYAQGDESVLFSRALEEWNSRV